jgi:hypothetical protein
MVGAGALALLASCQQVEAPGQAEAVPVTPQAQAVIDDYLRRVKGRPGALAISPDGARAAYHICQSYLWKNCDNYELNDRFVSIPSSRLAAQEALSRCGGGCRVLYLGEQRKR